MSVLDRLDAKALALVRSLASDWRCEPAAILAVIEVESAGRIFARVDGRDEPLIRFEGHYFHRRLSGFARSRAVVMGLAHPRAGRVRNPRSQAARWAMLRRARQVNERAALESCSWGLGQVMGAHWKRLGYPSVQALMREARRGAAGQIALMARFIENADLEPALAARDWHRFARTYNGPLYRRWGYHTKLKRAYARAERHAPPMAGPAPAPSTPELPAPAKDGVLGFGARGDLVRTLQRSLAGAGRALRVDGIFGLRTLAALKAWQRARGRAATGEVGLAEAWHLTGFAHWRTVLRRRWLRHAPRDFGEWMGRLARALSKGVGPA